MDKQMIEEMAKIMCGGCIENELMTCSFTHEEIPCDFSKNFAEALYNAGYRKIPENAVVLTKEEREEFNELYRSALKRAEKWEKLCGIKIKETRKETAEKIADWLDNEKGYCGLGYLVKQKFCTEEKEK